MNDSPVDCQNVSVTESKRDPRRPVCTELFGTPGRSSPTGVPIAGFSNPRADLSTFFDMEGDLGNVGQGGKGEKNNERRSAEHLSLYAKVALFNFPSVVIFK